MKTGFLFTLSILLVTACNKDSQHPIQSPNNVGWIVTTIAGDGSPHFADGPALQAKFSAPCDVSFTPGGAMYVADALNHRIRRIFNGHVTTFAGFDREDTTSGTGATAGFAIPIRLTSDIAGNIYTVDIHDFRIRKITPNGLVTVLAGNGVRGFADGRADTARFGEISGIAVDQVGNVFVADLDSRRIRKISTGGFVSTVAGNGASGFVDGNADSATFFSLGGLVIDKDGNLFVADWNRVRKITPDGQVSTFVGLNAHGFQDGAPSIATFVEIADLAIDAEGTIFVSDENRIRKITPQGQVSTVAGTMSGYLDGPGQIAQFNGANGLGIDSQGNVYVADSHNNRIRKVGKN